MRFGRRCRITGRNPTPVPLCPPQITHDLTWYRAWAAEREAGDWSPELWHINGFTLWFCVFWYLWSGRWVLHFGGTCCLHLQSRILHSVITQKATVCMLSRDLLWHQKIRERIDGIMFVLRFSQRWLIFWVVTPYSWVGISNRTAGRYNPEDRILQIKLPFYIFILRFF
jgi:hypothetical protein